jgi:hypothetical protein
MKSILLLLQCLIDPSCPDFAVSVEAKTHFAVWVLLEEIN